MAADDHRAGSETLGDAVEMPAHLTHLAERERVQDLELRRLFAEQEHVLRQSYADWILRILGAQFVVADIVFVAFAWVGEGWNLPPGVIEVWLAATVVQILGVAGIVTRHLFPSSEGQAASPWAGELP
jgi:hypothetical protein